MTEEIIDHIDTFLLEDYPFPAMGFTEKMLNEVFTYEPLPGDIFLATFPKCGTTWSQFIIWGILNEGAVPPDTNIMMMKEFPFLEFTGVKALENIPSPRLMKVHLPYRLTPKSLEAKYICVMRNPFDCCTSYYNHLNEIDAKIAGKVLNFETYFDDFVKGEVPFGDYFDQVQSWYDHKDDPNVLFITYEEMRYDPKAGILKIAEFLGAEHRQKLEDDPEMLDNVVKHSSFKYMKESKPFRVIKDTAAAIEIGDNLIKDMIDPSKYNDDSLFMTPKFYREGTVGGSRGELSSEQWQQIDKTIDAKIKYPELRQRMRRTKV